MNSQPVTTAKPVKSRLKLGLILGLILGLGVGVGACLPFVFDFKTKLEIETAEKQDVMGVLATTTKSLNEKVVDNESLNDKVAESEKRFGEESQLRQRLEKEAQQLVDEIAQLNRTSADQVKQIETEKGFNAESNAENARLKKEMADLQRERQSLVSDLEDTERRLKAMQTENDRTAQVPASQRRGRRDGTMTLIGMTEDGTMPLDGPINSMRIGDWPSKKQENRFCYESSRNGQRVTLYYNLIPFAVIEHKKLQSADTMVLSWKKDSQLFWTDAGKRNRNVSFEKMVIDQLSKTEVAFLYESKVANKEKYVELKFVDD